MHPQHDPTPAGRPPGVPAPTAGPGGAGPVALLTRIPPLPAVLGLLLIIGVILGLTGGGNAIYSLTASSTRGELCSAYSAMDSTFDLPDITSSTSFDDYLDDVDATEELSRLVKVAEKYDDAGVESDAKELDGLSGIFSAYQFHQASRHIAEECS
ncbi:hypothetical protein [Gordonia sp. VNK21]|uniref:hypothetical protein n=1 Tax=Gordonia sp. VNK21 TaxID=3382483 RepID=UPI0038D37800